MTSDAGVGRDSVPVNIRCWTWFPNESTGLALGYAAPILTDEGEQMPDLIPFTGLLRQVADGDLQPVSSANFCISSFHNAPGCRCSRRNQP